MAPSFIHLRARSAYSLLEGAIQLPRLLDLTIADKMPALGLTDRHNMCGALEFSERFAAAGVQPIIGVTLGVAFEECAATQRNDAHAGSPVRHIGLLAKDEAGYLNLMELSSRAYLDTDASETPHVSEHTLLSHTEGLIVTTGGVSGPLGALLCQEDARGARAVLERMAGAFGDGCTWSCSGTGWRAKRCARRPWPSLPTIWGCRSWPPTTPISPAARISSPTTR